MASATPCSSGASKGPNSRKNLRKNKLELRLGVSAVAGGRESSPPPARKLPFSLEYWKNEGIVIRSEECQAKVMKSRKDYSRVYQTLDTIAEDNRKGVGARMKYNTWGVVLSVMPVKWETSENAFLLEIYDERADAVSVLIKPPNPHAKLGPVVEPGPGDIIRLHNAAIRRWPNGMCKKSLLLGVTQLTYVIFRRTRLNFMFKFHTSMKTISWNGEDRTRVGELYMLRVIRNLDPQLQSINIIDSKVDSDLIILDEVQVQTNRSDSHEEDTLDTRSLEDADYQGEVAGSFGGDYYQEEEVVSSLEYADYQDEVAGSLGVADCQEEVASADELMCEGDTDEDEISGVSNPLLTSKKEIVPAPLGTSSNKIFKTKSQKQNIDETRFTEFKDLRISDDRVNLKCKVGTIQILETNRWVLHINDFNGTVPPPEFLPKAGRNTLTLTITNGTKFDARQISKILTKHEASGKVFAFLDVNVKVAQDGPYCKLEVDGENCVIVCK